MAAVIVSAPNWFFSSRSGSPSGGLLAGGGRQGQGHSGFCQNLARKLSVMHGELTKAEVNFNMVAINRPGYTVTSKNLCPATQKVPVLQDVEDSKDGATVWSKFAGRAAPYCNDCTLLISSLFFASLFASFNYLPSLLLRLQALGSFTQTTHCTVRTASSTSSRRRTTTR